MKSGRDHFALGKTLFEFYEAFYQSFPTFPNRLSIIGYVFLLFLV